MHYTGLNQLIRIGLTTQCFRITEKNDQYKTVTKSVNVACCKKAFSTAEKWYASIFEF